MSHMSKGFTLIEMIIAITIIGLLTIVSVAQFQSGRQDDALRLALMRINDALRTAQSSAQAGTLEQYQNAPRYGVHAFQKSTGMTCVNGSTTVNEGVILFADANDNGTYDAATDSLVKCVSLDVNNTHSIVIDGIKVTKTDDTVTAVSASAVSFRRPTAVVAIDGDTTMKKLSITLKNTKNSHTKVIEVDRVSGRIDAEY